MAQSSMTSAPPLSTYITHMMKGAPQIQPILDIRRRADSRQPMNFSVPFSVGRRSIIQTWQPLQKLIFSLAYRGLCVSKRFFNSRRVCSISWISPNIFNDTSSSWLTGRDEPSHQSCLWYLRVRWVGVNFTGTIDLEAIAAATLESGMVGPLGTVLCAKLVAWVLNGAGATTLDVSVDRFCSLCAAYF